MNAVVEPMMNVDGGGPGMWLVDSEVPEQDGLTDLMEAIRAAAASGDLQTGLDLADRACASACAVGDVLGQATALRERARFLTWSGELEAAVAACEEGRELLIGRGADRMWCDLAVAQAFALTGLGLGEEAMELLALAREVAQRVGDRELLYWVHNRTGLAYDSFGDHGAARELLKEALSLADAVDEDGRWSIITNLVNNAMALIPVLRASGRVEEAEQVLAEAIEQAEQVVNFDESAGHRYGLCLDLGNLGAIQQLAGRPEQALDTLERARRIAVEHDYRPLQMSALQHMPAALLDQGRIEDAISLLRDVLKQSVELGELPVQIEVLQRMAELYEKQGAYEQALASFRTFHEVERQLRSGRALARARLLAHQAHLEQARVEAAEARARSEQLLSDKLALMEQTVELQRHAHTDALTGLANRRYLDLALSAMHERALSLGVPLWIAVMDLDHFKQVNDSFGHSVGDLVLVRVAELLRAVCRPDDLVARHGGEEFLIAMLNVELDIAWKICERLRRRIEEEDWAAIAPLLSVTVSIGLSAATGGPYSEAVCAADRLLYLAKASGRNQIAGPVSADDPGLSMPAVPRIQ